MYGKHVRCAFRRPSQRSSLGWGIKSTPTPFIVPPSSSFKRVPSGRYSASIHGWRLRDMVNPATSTVPLRLQYRRSWHRTFGSARLPNAPTSKARYITHGVGETGRISAMALWATLVVTFSIRSSRRYESTNPQLKSSAPTTRG